MSMPKIWLQLIGVLGVVCLAYVIYSVVAQAPADRTPVITFALVVAFVCICVIAYTMLTGRR